MVEGGIAYRVFKFDFGPNPPFETLNFRPVGPNKPDINASRSISHGSRSAVRTKPQFAHPTSQPFPCGLAFFAGLTIVMTFG
jgi:hypothetical protein